MCSGIYHCLSFTKVIFGKDEKGPTLANALKEFFINVGIPMQMVTDGHNSYVGRDSEFYKTCRNRDVQLLVTEPGSSWQNKADHLLLIIGHCCCCVST